MGQVTRQHQKTIMTPKFYPTQAAAQAELAMMAKSCPLGFQLRARAYRAKATLLADEALEQDSWAKEMMARKYELLADLADHQGLHKFMVLADLKEDKLIDISPVEVPSGYSGKLEERWCVNHLRNDRWYVPYGTKRPQTLARYGYREVWVLLPAIVGTHSTEQGKHSALHSFKVKEAVVSTLDLPTELIERYKQRFSTFFTKQEQEAVFKHFLNKSEQALALDPYNKIRTFVIPSKIPSRSRMSNNNGQAPAFSSSKLQLRAGQRTLAFRAHA